MELDKIVTTQPAVKKEFDHKENSESEPNHEYVEKKDEVWTAEKVEKTSMNYHDSEAFLSNAHFGNDYILENNNEF